MTIIELILSILNNPDTQAAILVTLVVLAMTFSAVKVAKIIANAISDVTKQFVAALNGFRDQLKSLTAQLQAQQQAYLALQTNIIKLHTQQVAIETTRNTQQNSHNTIVGNALNATVDKLTGLDSLMSTSNEVAANTASRVISITETIQSVDDTLGTVKTALKSLVETDDAEILETIKQQTSAIIDLLTLLQEQCVEANKDKQAENDKPDEKKTLQLQPKQDKQSA